VRQISELKARQGSRVIFRSARKALALWLSDFRHRGDKAARAKARRAIGQKYRLRGFPRIKGPVPPMPPIKPPKETP
jgi:hypothetical protein